MATLTLLPDLPVHEVSADWPVLPEHTPLAKRLLRRLRPDEIKLLTVVALAGYVASALWVRFSLHFWINDALNRSDDALYVTIGRDPHLGAIGFYWPPLPQLLQLPLMPFLRPFGEEILAGPLMTALCMAATIPVLARLGRRLGLRRPTVLLICLAFAVTPDMIYTASNGMAESCFILSGAVTMLGFLTWIETRSTADVLVFVLGLSMLVMTRLEGPFVAIALIGIAVADLRHIKRSCWEALVIALPPAACYGFWLLVQWILLGDPLFFLHQGGGGAPGSGPPTDPGWLPPDIAHHPIVGLTWVGGWVLVLAPVLYLLAATLVVGPLSKRFRGTLGILAALGAILAIQFDQANRGGAFGDPRYFVMAVIFGAVAALWLASPRKRAEARLWNVGLVTLLLVGGAAGSYQLTSGRITHEEGECSYFQYGVGRVLPFLSRPQHGQYSCHTPGQGLAAWEQADHWIDGHLGGRDRIIADNASNYAAELFSTRPGLFIVRNDRDWSKTIAYPSNVNYVLTQSGSATGAPTVSSSTATDDGALLLSLDRPGWHLVHSFGGALDVTHSGTYVQLWHFVPSPLAGRIPTGTESNL